MKRWPMRLLDISSRAREYEKLSLLTRDERNWNQQLAVHTFVGNSPEYVVWLLGYIKRLHKHIDRLESNTHT